MKATIYVCDKHIKLLRTKGVGNGNPLPKMICQIEVARIGFRNVCPNPVIWLTSIEVTEAKRLTGVRIALWMAILVPRRVWDAVGELQFWRCHLKA